MKKLIRLILTVVVVLLVVKLCTDKVGGVISLPGGLGGSNSEESGGWFGPKEKTEGTVSDKDVPKDIKDLERELGIGTDDRPSSIYR